MATGHKWNKPTYDRGGGNELSYGIQVKFHGPLFRRGAVQEAIHAATKETLAYGKGIIKAATPIDTGLLESEWRSRVDQKTVYNEVPYSIFVEWGTSRMEPRYMAAFSLPAIQTHYADSISRHIGRALG